MTQEEFSSSVLIENKQIKTQLSEYSTAASLPGDSGKQCESPAQSGSVAVVPSALDCGILVPSEKVVTGGFAPSGARGPALSRPALAPPSKPRSIPPGGSGRRRRGSGAGTTRGGRGLTSQVQQDHPMQNQQNDLDCAILVPSGNAVSAAYFSVFTQCAF